MGGEPLVFLQFLHLYGHPLRPTVLGIDAPFASLVALQDCGTLRERPGCGNAEQTCSGRWRRVQSGMDCVTLISVVNWLEDLRRSMHSSKSWKPMVPRYQEQRMTCKDDTRSTNDRTPTSARRTSPNRKVQPHNFSLQQDTKGGAVLCTCCVSLFTVSLQTHLSQQTLVRSLKTS